MRNQWYLTQIVNQIQYAKNTKEAVCILAGFGLDVAHDSALVQLCFDDLKAHSPEEGERSTKAD